MEYTVQQGENGQYLYLRVTGHVTHEEAVKLLNTIVDARIPWRSTRYLLDFTDAYHDWSVLDDCEFAHRELQQQDESNPMARYALLVSPAAESLDFIATRARYAGMNAWLFREKQRAVDFLFRAITGVTTANS